MRKRDIDGTLVTSVAEELRKDRRYTVRELSGMFDVSIGSIQSILTKELNMGEIFYTILFHLPRSMSTGYFKKLITLGYTVIIRIISPDCVYEC
jgi:hypothetical protein